jgi:hypothetical protein
MSDEYSEDYISRWPKSLRWIDYKGRRALAWLLTLSAEERLYSAGGIILLVAVILFALKSAGACPLWQVGMFVFALGLMLPLEKIYEWLWSRLYGKLMMIGLIALITNIAYGCGRQLVALLISTNPEPFSATVNVATILLSPLLFFGGLATIGFFVFVVASYCGTLALMTCMTPLKINRNARFWPAILRILALGFAVFGSWSILKQTNGYMGWAAQHCAQYLYTFDLYHDARYTTNSVEKIVVLSDGRLLVGFPSDGGEYKFEIRLLELKK